MHSKERTMTARDTTQPLLPLHLSKAAGNSYNLYPAHPLGKGSIHSGYTSLAAWMAKHELVLIDGYAGIDWTAVQEVLEQEFKRSGITVQWQLTSEWMKSAADIDTMVAPFVGEPEEVWGTRTTLQLGDFFMPGKTAAFKVDTAFALNIVIGPGAALAHPLAPVVYLDIPKNELQYRMRAEAAYNLGSTTPDAPAEMYKRSYFVDWVVLNEYKQTLLQRIQVFADTQWPEAITWASGTDLQEGIDSITRSHFRVRPWFEPGAWGGQWMKQHIPGLNQEAKNYAWSFEMIVPENGVVFESDGLALELPFEWLMFYQHKAILGKHADIFRYEFPIRFDFLDTFDGGNLSIQCHPTVQYIREHFGETFTQDETYYILDCKPGAGVYLGFQQGIDPAGFRTVLEQSRDQQQAVDITQYVQLHTANKHDLFLIPNGTVHSAGVNNMVLEISATPYIFTFKMYDWLRPGLDGKPRSISIDHAFRNLDFSRQGAVVNEQLISAPKAIQQGADWQIIHLPTHAVHFYDVHRLEFDSVITVPTDDCCLVMMLVEGSSITISMADGGSMEYHYAETFVIPAAAGACEIRNNGAGRAKLIKAFLKPEHAIFNDLISRK